FDHDAHAAVLRVGDDAAKDLADLFHDRRGQHGSATDERADELHAEQGGGVDHAMDVTVVSGAFFQVRVEVIVGVGERGNRHAVLGEEVVQPPGIVVGERLGGDVSGLVVPARVVGPGGQLERFEPLFGSPRYDLFEVHVRQTGGEESY